MTGKEACLVRTHKRLNLLDFLSDWFIFTFDSGFHLLFNIS